MIEEILKTLKQIDTEKQCLEKFKGIILDTSPFENKIDFYTMLLKAQCSAHKDDIEFIKNNKLRHISEATAKCLFEFRANHYGLQSIQEDYPDDDLEYFIQSEKYWKSQMNYYKSLGVETLEKINFILNIEEILKDYI
jgi:hypothetical protein